MSTKFYVIAGSIVIYVVSVLVGIRNVKKEYTEDFPESIPNLIEVVMCLVPILNTYFVIDGLCKYLTSNSFRCKLFGLDSKKRKY